MLAAPAFAEACRFWLKLGLISFGGPAGQIAIMHRELVDRKKWVDESRFLHALNFCMLLPGPEAQQLATYCGWLLHGTRGGLVAGGLFVLPSALLLWSLSLLYVKFGHIPGVLGVFSGLKPAVLAIIVVALVRIGRRAIRGVAMLGLALLAFVLLFFAHVPFPAIIFGAALAGFILARTRPHWLATPGVSDASPRDDRVTPAMRPSWARAARVLSIGGVLWFTPVMVAWLLTGASGTLTSLGVFFSKAAVVTFGGAYAVLPYVGQQAVDSYGWLTAPQMLDGLAFAETTPGPLIMVLQFVGFMAGWNHPGTLPSLPAATLGAALTTWVTFVPCFIWIFLGAPYVERLRQQRLLSSALAAVTASVVGVILNLAVWMALQILFHGTGTIDPFALSLAVVAFICLQWLKVDVVPVILGAALIGFLASLR